MVRMIIVGVVMVVLSGCDHVEVIQKGVVDSSNKVATALSGKNVRESWKSSSVALNGAHPIHIAAMNNDLEGLKKEIKNSPSSVNAQNAVKSTPLHLAAMFGNGDAVKLLLKSGATPSSRDAQGFTPLFQAVNGLAGATAEGSDDAKTGGVYYRIFKQLTDAGASWNVTNENGASPLAYVLENLNQAGGRQNVEQNASFVGDLVVLGADPFYVVSGWQDSALGWAVKKCYPETVKALIEKVRSRFGREGAAIKRYWINKKPTTKECVTVQEVLSKS